MPQPTGPAYGMGSGTMQQPSLQRPLTVPQRPSSYQSPPLVRRGADANLGRPRVGMPSQGLYGTGTARPTYGIPQPGMRTYPSSSPPPLTAHPTGVSTVQPPIAPQTGAPRGVATPHQQTANPANPTTTATTGPTTSVETGPVIHPSVHKLWELAKADLPNEHVLTRYLRWAQGEVVRLEEIKDYSAVLIKEERVHGRLLPEQQIAMKLRHEPFSVYLRFLGPQDVQDREVLYVDGANDGNLIAHEGRGLLSLGPSVPLAPDSSLAMKDQKYPLTDIGLLTLVNKFIETCERESKSHECEVRCYPSYVKLDGRPCTCLMVVHPLFREEFMFHVAYVYIDDEWGIPVRYEAYDWPEEEGESPPLLESYTYARLQFNRGFGDIDFDTSNEDYNFE
jgi:hypothetical protein